MKPRPGARERADFATLTAAQHAAAGDDRRALPASATPGVASRENPQTSCSDPRSERASPDPMRATDRYRLVIPYSMRL
jgi:hypothetical protein